MEKCHDGLISRRTGASPATATNSAHVAQLEERLICIQEAVSSNLTRSTKLTGWGANSSKWRISLIGKPLFYTQENAGAIPACATKFLRRGCSSVVERDLARTHCCTRVHVKVCSGRSMSRVRPPSSAHWCLSRKDSDVN